MDFTDNYACVDLIDSRVSSSFPARKYLNLALVPWPIFSAGHWMWQGEGIIALLDEESSLKGTATDKSFVEKLAARLVR